MLEPWKFIQFYDQDWISSISLKTEANSTSLT